MEKISKSGFRITEYVKDPFIVVLFIIAGIFIFTNLANIYLWTDEAETAVIAKNTLKHGIPSAYDGKNILWVDGGFGPNYIWIYHTWLQFYICAFSFLIFGFNNFAARLPFAILGLLSVFLTFRLSYKLFDNKIISRISALLLVFSIPFILHVRQCRYYSLTIFTVLLVLLLYLQFAERKRFSPTKLAISLILLFHSNHGAFIPVFAALFLHYIIFYFTNKDLKRFLYVCMPVFLFTLPWFVWLKSWHHGQDVFDFNHTRQHFEFYLRTINKYVFPSAFFGVILTMYLIIKRRIPSFPSSINKPKFYLLVYIILATLGFLLFVEQRHFRYVIYLIPLLFMIEAVILFRWWEINRYLAVLVLSVLMFSSFLNSFKLGFPLVGFLYEISHDYDGPMEGIVKYLQANAKASDTVKIPYGDRVVVFYTDLSVDGRQFLKNLTYPEWIAWRDDWIDKGEVRNKYLKEIEQKYQKIVLDYPDIYWENRPEPGYHKFKTVTDFPRKVVIYKRIK